MDDRRRYPRLKQPLEGRWLGQSGTLLCRISDISWGGCFIETLAMPAIGEGTTVTVPVSGTTIDIQGRVAYAEKTMGFGLVFDTLTADQIDALTDLLGEPPASLLT